MDWIRWKQEATQRLEELQEIDFGYLLGQNLIHLPASLEESCRHLASAGITDNDIHAFYSLCDGLSWPDVHHGYFLKHSRDLPAKPARAEVAEVVGPIPGQVVVLGSSGGGDLIAIRKSEGDILWLPPAGIEGSTYHDKDGKVQVVGADFPQFMSRLTEDLRAFVYDTRPHSYLPQCFDGGE